MATASDIHWPAFRWKRTTETAVVAGWTYLIVNIFASATYNVFAKALTGGLPPTALLFVSESLTLFFAFFFFGVVPTIKHLLRMDRKAWMPMIAIGVSNGIVAPFLWFMGLQYTTAVNAALFNNAEMVFLIILAVLFLRESWTRIHTISVAAIVIGILVIGLRGFTEGITLHGGDALLLMAGFSFSVGSLVFRKYLHHGDPRLVLFMRSFLPVSMFFLLSPFMPVPFISEIRSFPIVLLPALLGFGLISRFMNTFTFYQAIDRLPITTVSLVENLTLVVGVVFAHFMLQEPVMAYHWVGGIFIVLGTLLLELTGSKVPVAHMESHMVTKKTARA